jgi:predicted RNase H-like HicB family nuclease
MAMVLTAILTPAPEGGYTATNPETGATSQGKTLDAALTSLREATELYLEEFALPAGQSIITTFEVAVNAQPATVPRR